MQLSPHTVHANGFWPNSCKPSTQERRRTLDAQHAAARFRGVMSEGELFAGPVLARTVLHSDDWSVRVQLNHLVSVQRHLPLSCCCPADVPRTPLLSRGKAARRRTRRSAAERGDSCRKARGKLRALAMHSVLVEILRQHTEKQVHLQQERGKMMGRGREGEGQAEGEDLRGEEGRQERAGQGAGPTAL